METRAAYTLIGTFVVLGFVALFAVGIWFTGSRESDDSTDYLIFIEESVAGLEIGSNVKYRGIVAGSVKAMTINPDNPQQVRIVAEIRNEFPIREGDVAALTLEGITGYSVVNIQGAQPGSRIIPSSDENPATIPARVSDIGALLTGTPELLAESVVLVQRISDLFNEDNRQVVGRILGDVQVLTEMLADNEQELNNLVTTVTDVAADIRILSSGLEDMSRDANLMLTEMRSTLKNIDQLFSTDGRALVREWQETAESLSRITDNADALLVSNRDAINDFTTQGLTELTSFLHEGRILVSGLSRILDKLESGGAGFLLNKPASEYTPN